jgi:hypothetical protein
LQTAAEKLPGDARPAEGLARKELAKPVVKKAAVYRRRRWR